MRRRNILLQCNNLLENDGKACYNEAMIIRLLVVSALLTGFTTVAVAADKPEHTSKNARQVVILLGHIGINSAELVEFADYVDQKVYKGRFHIAEERGLNGAFQLNYRLSGGLSTKQIELRFAPDDAPYEASAGTNRIMVTYKLKF